MRAIVDSATPGAAQSSTPATLVPMRLAAPFKRRFPMPTMEQVELDRYHAEMKDDVRHLFSKYGRIMGWDIPDLDDTDARRQIGAALREAVEQVAAE